MAGTECRAAGRQGGQWNLKVENAFWVAFSAGRIRVIFFFFIFFLIFYRL